MTLCLSLRARLALAAESSADALQLAQRAVSAARQERSGDQIKDQYAIAAELRLLGDVRRRAGDEIGARAAWSDGLDILPANVIERPGEMHERAQLLKRLGRADEAKPIVAKLATIGFRQSN